MRFIKLRLLSHHTIEGPSRCAMSRVQVSGSSLPEIVDRVGGGTGAGWGWWIWRSVEREMLVGFIEDGMAFTSGAQSSPINGHPVCGLPTQSLVVQTVTPSLENGKVFSFKSTRHIPLTRAPKHYTPHFLRYTYSVPGTVFLPESLKLETQ